jgi:hypothetical protein
MPQNNRRSMLGSTTTSIKDGESQRRNEMFQSKIIGKASVAVRRVAAVALVGSLCLIGTAAPVSAQSLVGGGKIYAAVDCNLATKTASVSVAVMEPAKFASSGLVFYTELWAKARHETRYNLIRAAQSPVIKTWSQYNPNPFVSSQLSWMNSPKTVFTGAFTGNVEAYYDIYVKYWYRVPTSSSWAGFYGFTVATDADSVIYITSNDGYGNLSSQASNCFL